MPNNQFSSPAATDNLSNLAVLILAAGLSRRLGQPKQLLLKNGKPLVRHVTELAVSLNLQSIVIVANNNIDVANVLKDLPIHIVLNSQTDTGMASSLQTGANFLQDHRAPILIVGIDQPLLNADFLQQLVQQNIKYPMMNIVSHYNDTIGIPAIVQPEILQLSHALSGDTGLKKLLIKQPDSMIKVAAPQLAFDIDTPEDLIDAREQGWID